jgi:ankyrin repeat protein
VAVAQRIAWNLFYLVARNQLYIRLCEKGLNKPLEYLLCNEARLDPNVADSRPLMNACSNGHTESVRLLLTHPLLDPSANCNVALRSAFLKGELAITKLLLADPRIKNLDDLRFPFIWASGNGYHSMVKAILEYVPTIDTATCNEALDWACKNGHSQVVNVLLKRHGAH